MTFTPRVDLKQFRFNYLHCTLRSIFALLRHFSAAFSNPHPIRTQRHQFPATAYTQMKIYRALSYKPVQRWTYCRSEPMAESLSQRKPTENTLTRVTSRTEIQYQRVARILWSIHTASNGTARSHRSRLHGRRQTSGQQQRHYQHCRHYRPPRIANWAGHVTGNDVITSRTVAAQVRTHVMPLRQQSVAVW